jgi:hypothetical protein
VFGLKNRSRVLIGAAAGLMLALFALTPVQAAPAGSYSGEANGEALSLSLTAPGSADPAVSVDAGISHADLDSTPHAAASGSGLVQIPGTTAETDAPPDDTATAALLDQSVGIPGLANLAIAIAKGSATSEVSGDPTASGEGELVGVNLELSPGGIPLLGTPTFAVRSTSDVKVVGDKVTAEGHSDEVKITLQLGDDLVSPVCELLGTLPLPINLGEACTSAVDQVAPLTNVATVRILPADAVCTYNGANETASADAHGALLSVQLFDAEPIVVEPGLTIDLLDGTPLHIHAVVGDATTSVNGSSASAEADALRLELFEDILPHVRLAASHVTCGVSGQLPPEPPPVPRTPVTGGVLPPVMLGAAALFLVGLGARRFAKVV